MDYAVIFKSGVLHCLAILAPVGMNKNYYVSFFNFLQTVYLFKMNNFDLGKRDIG
jgi:hypothetical protein